MQSHGYDDQRAALRDFLSAGSGVAAVWGPPGAGKTHLVRTVAPQALHVTIGDEGLVLALAEALGIPPGGEPDPQQTGLTAVRTQGRPVVLDDVVASDPEVRHWLEQDPGVPVILAGRARPGDLAGPIVHVGGLDEDAAAALLHARCPDQDPTALRAVARRLEGLPLALELAAARLSVLTPAELLDRLHDLFDTLDGVSSGERSLQTVIAEAWAPLSPVQKRVLALVAALDPGPDLPLLEALEPGSLDALQVLIDGSLVRREPPCGGRARFRAVVGMREYARTHVPDPGPIRDALEARARAELATWHHDAHAVARLRRDAPIHRAWCTAVDEHPASLIASVLPRIGRRPPGVLLEELREARRPGHRAALDVLRARVLRDAGRLDEARALLDAIEPDPTLDLLRPHALPLTRARLALTSGHLAHARELGAFIDAGAGDAIVAASLLMAGEIDRARTAWEAALERLESEGDQAGLAWSLPPFAALEEWAGHPERSIVLFDRAAAIAARRGHRTRLLVAEHGRAYARLDAGHTAEALAQARDLEQRTRHAGLERRAVDAGVLHADALDDLGERSDAETLRRRLLPLARTRQRSAVGLLRICLHEPLADDEREAQTGWVRALADAVAARADGGDPRPHLDHPGLTQGAPGLWARLIALGVDGPHAVLGAGLPHALRSVSVRREVRAADARLPRAERRALWARTLDEPARSLVIGSDGLRLPGGETLDWSRRALWRRLVLALVDAPDGLDSDGLVAAGWPGERMRADAAMNRLHKTLSQLRRAGLAGLLLRDGDRYHLDPAVPRWRLPQPGQWSGDVLRTLVATLRDTSALS